MDRQNDHASGYHKCHNESLAEGTNFSASFKETTFIFDWDDTIMPSTWLKCEGLVPLESAVVLPQHVEQLAKLADTAVEMVRQAQQRGTVVIITNADEGWVELSCHRYMPALWPLIKKSRIISARTMFECARAPLPSEWKLLAFRREIARSYGPDRKTPKNIISIGDGPHEREALLRSTAELENCRAKSLKFFEEPEIAELSQQQTIVTGSLERIVSLEVNLDLRMEDNAHDAALPESIPEASI